MIEMGKKYQTRSGRPVRLLSIDDESRSFPVVGRVDTSNGEALLCWTADGKALLETGYCSLDLVPVLTKHEEWRLRERSGFMHSYRYDTEAEADSERADGEVVVRITWED
jgi:hypothetical protein